MKRKTSLVQKIGVVGMWISAILFVVSMLLCFTGKNSGIILLFASLFLIVIFNYVIKLGIKITENYYGDDSENNDR